MEDATILMREGERSPRRRPRTVPPKAETATAKRDRDKYILLILFSYIPRSLKAAISCLSRERYTLTISVEKKAARRATKARIR